MNSSLNIAIVKNLAGWIGSYWPTSELRAHTANFCSDHIQARVKQTRFMSLKITLGFIVVLITINSRCYGCSLGVTNELSKCWSTVNTYVVFNLKTTIH